MSKKTNSYEEVVKKLYHFNNKRGWLGLDSADLAKSIVLEAAELLEHYQWDNSRSKKEQSVKKKDIDEISSEVADVFIYILIFCHENNIDLLKSTMKKMGHNDKKYPVNAVKNK